MSDTSLIHEILWLSFNINKPSKINGKTIFKNNLFLEQETILTKKNGQYIKIDFEDILFCKAEGSYTRVYIKKDYQDIVICKCLNYLDKLLKKHEGFLRCHKSYLINVKKVDFFCSRSRKLMISDFKVPISRRKSLETYQILLRNDILDRKN